MRAGQEASRAIYLEVFHGQRPRFGDWNIDYRFATPSNAEQSLGSSERNDGRTLATVELPPEIQVDLNLRKAEQAVREGDAATASEAMQRLVSLQAEHGLQPTPEDLWRYAEAWAAGEPTRARAAAVRYLQLHGREAERYTEALDLINREGSLESAPADANAAAGRIEPAGPAEVSAADARRAGASQVFHDMDFVWVPAGEFLMGSDSPEAWFDEQPVTRVRISKGFWLGKYEVTQSAWQAVTGTNPSRFSGCGNCPVDSASWDDAQAFIRQLNGRAGGDRYRLPTEAEWDYAARAGTSGYRYGNLDAIAWCGESPDGPTPPVGQKAPNAWGLHDMLGNVEEWVEDSYFTYPGGSVTDPRAADALFRMRGGSWSNLGGVTRPRTAGRPIATAFRSPSEESMLSAYAY